MRVCLRTLQFQSTEKEGGEGVFTVCLSERMEELGFDFVKRLGTKTRWTGVIRSTFRFVVIRSELKRRKYEGRHPLGLQRGRTLFVHEIWGIYCEPVDEGNKTVTALPRLLFVYLGPSPGSSGVE